MTTLLVDNYDSYTYNVFHLLASVSGEEPIVIQNDTVSWGALSRWDFDAIVISPGPGRPERWHDFGVCADILRWSDTPILGVCLGHQGLGHLLNGAVSAAPKAMHGRMSHVRHLGTGLFADIPQDFSVVRYHSLAVTQPVGPDGIVTAWTEDGVVMGIEHTSRPIWGVQFHPESISTEHGRTLVENFYSLARSRKRPRPPGAKRLVTPAQRPAAPSQSEPSRLQLHVRCIEGEPVTEPVFEALFADADYAFWLDSVDPPTRLAQCSYMGTTAGTERGVLEYDVDEGAVTIRRGESTAVEHGSIFEILDRELARNAITPPEEIARGLIGGYVGYLGYECKADCGSRNVHSSDLPDAVLMLANRVIAVDHVAKRTHVLAVGAAEDPDAQHWLEEAETVVRETIAAGAKAISEPVLEDRLEETHPVLFNCGRGRRQYLADIARCQAALAAGESYEVCLTDQISTAESPDPFHLYRLLRRSNPAPFAAYLKLGGIAVVSSSPERFLSVDRERRVQARPIKGTAPRAQDPAADEAIRQELLHDEKTFAEHLMIVDLLRNDLGRVCEVDSVAVPEFMAGERYRTVHQLTSTIVGVLAENRSAVDCVRACFPGGSMTGAPKLRTMEIIDDIEREARGVYSGGVGYFGLNGSVDLSIVIRTIVLRPGRTTIGAGGAIVMQSDPEEEFNEILLKARAPMAAIAQAVTGSQSADAWTVEVEPSSAMSSAS
ncbi:MAG TPA: aminodeoxychorismate synthase component I [Solirubrobacteraceae bacterium]|jgi:para-aminobenzoate synthetase|nr:aminodeoxychorismate synthase component I [Solirubrobacteraceae bacterium]